MTGQTPLDPTAVWRDAVAQWEKSINEVANQTMGSPEFAKSMHGAMGTSLTAQKSIGDLMGRYLTSMNLPSRDEVAALGERLSGIEGRLIRITTLIERLAGPAATSSAAPKVLRTKQPPPREGAAQPGPASEKSAKAAAAPPTKKMPAGRGAKARS